MEDKIEVVSTVVIRSDGTVTISSLTGATAAQIEAGIWKALEFVRGHKSDD